MVGVIFAAATGAWVVLVLLAAPTAGFAGWLMFRLGRAWSGNTGSRGAQIQKGLVDG